MICLANSGRFSLLVRTLHVWLVEYRVVEVCSLRPDVCSTTRGDVVELMTSHYGGLSREAKRSYRDHDRSQIGSPYLFSVGRRSIGSKTYVRRVADGERRAGVFSAVGRLARLAPPNSRLSQNQLDLTYSQSETMEQAPGSTAQALNCGLH